MRTCRVEDCEKPTRRGERDRAYCSMHERRLYRNGSVDRLAREPEYEDGSECITFGCSDAPHARNRCAKCYSRMAHRHKVLMLLATFGGACCDCGGIFPPEVYDFHHRDPSSKENGGIGGLMAAKARWSVLLSEAKKCDILCANCHRTRHVRGQAA